jgi:hypothetical protein
MDIPASGSLKFHAKVIPNPILCQVNEDDYKELTGSHEKVQHPY